MHPLSKHAPPSASSRWRTIAGQPELVLLPADRVRHICSHTVSAQGVCGHPRFAPPKKLKALLVVESSGFKIESTTLGSGM